MMGDLAIGRSPSSVSVPNSSTSASSMSAAMSASSTVSALPLSSCSVTPSTTGDVRVVSTPVPLTEILGVPASFVRRTYAHECGDYAASTLLDGNATETLQWHALLVAMALKCGDNTSFLPFAGREVWHRHADVSILAHEASVTARRLEDGCAARRGSAAARACIVFLDSRVAPFAARDLLEYLEGHPRERAIIVSSSNYDDCMPDMANWLLSVPQVALWFVENACEEHHKLRVLPIGPKFRSSHAFGAEDVSSLRKLYLSAMGAAVTSAATGRPPRVGMAVVVNEETSETCSHHPFRGIRSRAMSRMSAVAEELSEMSPGSRATLRNGSLSREDYLVELTRRRFVWSPPGAGVDVHRTWESLLVLATPVVIRSPISSVYSGLPVIEVSDFGTSVSASSLVSAEDELGHAFPGHLQVPVPQVFAFWWLAQIEAAAADFPPDPPPHRVKLRARNSLAF
jgi:hypothetical protein